MTVRIRALAALWLVFALAIAALVGSTRADATLSSGLPAGPIGTPVISTVDLTNRADLLVVGDSITVRSYRALPPVLPGKLIAINAQSGRNTALSIDSLITQLNAGAKLPGKLVMATGANDVFNTHAMAPQVQRLLALVKAKSPATVVFWVDVSVRRPAYAVADMLHSAVINAAIRKYCVGTCRVISWAGFLARYGRAGYIDAGGVHPTPAGQVAWAKLIAAAVK